MPKASSNIKAVIELGSNSVRFMIAKTKPRFQELYFERLHIRLGTAVFKTGRIPEKLIGQLVSEIARLAVTATFFGSSCQVIATSAVRESKNKNQLIAAIKNRTGLELEILSTKDEITYGIAGIQSKIKLGKNPYLLADLGGGSLELSIIQKNKLQKSISLPIGTVRLLKLKNKDIPLTLFKKFPEWEYPKTLIATGGNIEKLWELSDQKKTKSGAGIITLKQLNSLYKKISLLKYADRIKELGLAPDRADVIVPAALVYLTLAEVCQTEQILIPFAGVKEGALLDIGGDDAPPL